MDFTAVKYIGVREALYCGGATFEPHLGYCFELG
jgi:hypothetical protein